MGGTSADIAHRRPRRASARRRRATRGSPATRCSMPMFDIQTIGAGGGSIAYVDEAGAFRVGPRSAGADPGPACYGLGGDEPTITDAHVVLGRLDPERFLGGGMTLDPDARAARPSARSPQRLGLGPDPRPPRASSSLANAQHGARPSARSPSSAATTRATSASSRSAAPGRCTRPSSPRRSGSARCSSRRTRASRRPPGLLTSDLRYDQMRTVFMVEGAIDGDGARPRLDALAAELVERLRRDGADPDGIVEVARARLPLRRPGLRAAHPGRPRAR